MGGFSGVPMQVFGAGGCDLLGHVANVDAHKSAFSRVKLPSIRPIVHRSSMSGTEAAVLALAGIECDRCNEIFFFGCKDGSGPEKCSNNVFVCQKCEEQHEALVCKHEDGYSNGWVSSQEEAEEAEERSLPATVYDEDDEGKVEGHHDYANSLSDDDLSLGALACLGPRPRLLIQKGPGLLVHQSPAAEYVHCMAENCARSFLVHDPYDMDYMFLCDRCGHRMTSLEDSLQHLMDAQPRDSVSCNLRTPSPKRRCTESPPPSF